MNKKINADRQNVILKVSVSTQIPAVHFRASKKLVGASQWQKPTMKVGPV